MPFRYRAELRISSEAKVLGEAILLSADKKNAPCYPAMQDYLKRKIVREKILTAYSSIKEQPQYTTNFYKLK